MSDVKATTWRIGPAGWSYPDWAGIVYPTVRPRGFRPLVHIARLFSAVEVNSSFYATPSPRTTESWTRQVPADFRFAFKLGRRFTHEREAVPSEPERATFKDALAPVRECGMLGPLLIQFPWSFRFSRDSADWLLRTTAEFAEYERVVEVRHSSWSSDAALDVIRRAGAFCNIDQPSLHDCLKPSAHVFGAVGYVRFHGRNAANWFAQNQPGYERYNYLYSTAELREWVRRLNEVAASAREVYVVMNNHYRGQGVANGIELRSLLGLPPLSLPRELVEHYPRLAAISAPPVDRTLFEL